MQVIPNEESWIGFIAGASAIVDPDAPTAAEIASATDVTDLLITINATTTGNTVPTPRLKRRFETSIAGTASGQFTAQFYRDNEDDVAWDLLPRGTVGTFLISRFGGTGTDHAPALGNKLEVWEIEISSRAGDGLASNTAQTFNVTAAVPVEPSEDAVAAA